MRLSYRGHLLLLRLFRVGSMLPFGLTKEIFRTNFVSLVSSNPPNCRSRASLLYTLHPNPTPSMKFIVILAHPRLESYNHAIAGVVCETLRERGHEVVFHDLYAEGFDPLLSGGEIFASEDELPHVVRQFIGEIHTADGLIFVHPNWWSGPPAILRGWIERVFRQGFAYHFTPEGPVPHLTDKEVFVFTTSNTPREIEVNVYKSPIEHFWKVVVFGLCGCKSFHRTNFEPIILSTPEDRGRWLEAVRNELLEVYG